jgi:hypothetical protein
MTLKIVSRRSLSDFLISSTGRTVLSEASAWGAVDFTCLDEKLIHIPSAADLAGAASHESRPDRVEPGAMLEPKRTGSKTGARLLRLGDDERMSPLDHSAEWRRALKMLADLPEGSTLLLAHGFTSEVIAGLVDTGLASSINHTCSRGSGASLLEARLFNLTTATGTIGRDKFGACG